jgi:hypothetical protein
MKNSIVSSSIFFNSMESLYKYHYKIQYYNLLNPKSTCRTTIVVLTGQEQTSFILTTDKTRVFAEVVGSTPTRSTNFHNSIYHSSKHIATKKEGYCIRPNLFVDVHLFFQPYSPKSPISPPPAPMPPRPA